MLQRILFIIGVFVIVGSTSNSQVYPSEKHVWKLPIYLTTDEFYQPLVPDPNNIYPPGSVEQINQSLPRLQLIKIAVDNLVPILTAYRDSKSLNNPEMDSLLKTATKFQFFQQKINQYGVRGMSSTDLGIVAELSDRGRFKVVGTSEERLGINDGLLVYINILKLNKLNEFSFQQALLLIMHEIFHFDNFVPLGKRDLIAADIASWVEARTDMIPLEDQKVLFVVRLNSPPPAILNWQDVHDKLYTSKRSYIGAALIFSQSEQSVKMEWDLYGVFQTIKDTDPIPMRDLVFYMPIIGEHYILPFFKVTSISRGRSGKFKMSYLIENKYYSRIKGSQNYQLSQISFTPKEDFYDAKFIVEISRDLAEIETTRVSPKDLSTAFFSLRSVSKVNGRKILSVQLEGIDGASLIASKKPVMLSVVETKSGRSLIFVSTDKEQISEQSLMVNFEVSDIEMRLDKVTVDLKNTYGVFNNEILTPRQPILVPGNTISPSPGTSNRVANIQIKSHYNYFDINSRLNNNYPPTHLEIEFESPRVLKYIAADIYHMISWYNTCYERPPDNTTILDSSDQANFFFKQRYFYPILKETYQGKLNLVMPMPISLTLGFSRNELEKHTKMNQIPWYDSGDRLISTLTLHFSDGTTELVNLSKLSRFKIRDEFNNSLLSNAIDPL